MTIPRILAACWLFSPACFAWHSSVHVQITRAAFDSLPAEMRHQWSVEADRIAREYSLYPDRLVGAAEPEFTELAVYALKPDGQPIHNIAWQPDDDLRSLEFSLQGIVAAMREGAVDRAARHAGVLAHFLEDSTCPAHALIPADSPLESMRERFAPDEKQALMLHPAIERSAPALDLAARTPRQAGGSVGQAAQTLLERCYVIVRQNREELETIVKAVYSGDTVTADRIRLAAARRGAELVADAWYTALLLAARPR
jgi:hypothetical protein